MLHVKCVESVAIMARDLRMARASCIPRGLFTLFLIGLYLLDSAKGNIEIHLCSPFNIAI